jgi:hypothetical protein
MKNDIVENSVDKIMNFYGIKKFKVRNKEEKRIKNTWKHQNTPPI